MMSGFEPRTMKVTMYQSDWQQRVDDARAAALAAESAWEAAKKAAERQVRTLSDEAPEEALRVEYKRLAAEHDRLKEQAESEGCVVVTLKALPRRRWAELVTANPPRTGEEFPQAVRDTDAEYGVNDAAFGDAVVPQSIVDLDGTEMDAAEFVEVISSAQFDLLYGAAFALNRGAGSNPKAASRLTPSQSSGATENSPAASA